MSTNTYNSKRTQIQAIRWTGDNFEKVKTFLMTNKVIEDDLVYTGEPNIRPSWMSDEDWAAWSKAMESIPPPESVLQFYGWHGDMEEDAFAEGDILSHEDFTAEYEPARTPDFTWMTHAQLVQANRLHDTVHPGKPGGLFETTRNPSGCDKTWCLQTIPALLDGAADRIEKAAVERSIDKRVWGEL